MPANKTPMQFPRQSERLLRLTPHNQRAKSNPDKSVAEKQELKKLRKQRQHLMLKRTRKSEPHARRGQRH
jgi:hypothetical protein